MKAVTLTQPWATLVSIGAKKWETRDWSTPYRGPLAIHAAKSFPDWARDLCISGHFLKALVEAGISSPDALPLGAVVATCQITACLRTEDVLADRRLSISPRQFAFGNWQPGRWAWRLEDVVRIREPVPARGSLGLWEWGAEEAGVEVLVTGTLF